MCCCCCCNIRCPEAFIFIRFVFVVIVIVFVLFELVEPTDLMTLWGGLVKLMYPISLPVRLCHSIPMTECLHHLSIMWLLIVIIAGDCSHPPVTLSMSPSLTDSFTRYRRPVIAVCTTLTTRHHQVAIDCCVQMNRWLHRMMFTSYYIIMIICVCTHTHTFSGNRLESEGERSICVWVCAWLDAVYVDQLSI